MRAVDVDRKREGVFTKKSVILNAKQMPRADWWDQYGKHMPIRTPLAW